MTDQPNQLPPPAWYPDPRARFDLRYWDGAKWTEHVSTAGQPAVDPLPVDPPSAQRSVVQENHMATNGVPAENYDLTLLEQKITWRTDTRKLAQSLQEEGKALVAKIEALEAIRRSLLIDRERAQAEVKTLSESTAVFRQEEAAKFAELETEIDKLSQENTLLKERLEATLGLDAADLTLRAQTYRAEEVTLRSTIADLQGQVNELKDQLIVNRERLVLEDSGFFDYEHPAEDSIKLRVSLDTLRTKIKAAIKDDKAIQAMRNFTSRARYPAAQARASRAKHPFLVSYEHLE